MPLSPSIVPFLSLVYVGAVSAKRNTGVEANAKTIARQEGNHKIEYMLKSIFR